MNPSIPRHQTKHETASRVHDQKWSGENQDLEKQVSIHICQFLRAERERQNLSQQRLSEMADISRSGLRHMESLNTSPTLFSLLKVAEALGVKISDLLQKLDR